jgi:hypothetical protein
MQDADIEDEGAGPGEDGEDGRNGQDATSGFNGELGLYHIMFVLDDPNHLDEVLDAWFHANVRGVTIMESTGLYRRRARALGARYAFGFPRLFGGAYAGHFTLAAIVGGRPAVRAALEAAESVVGDLDEPSTGVFAAWPVTFAKGAVERPWHQKAGKHDPLDDPSDGAQG